MAAATASPSTASDTKRAMRIKSGRRAAAQAATSAATCPREGRMPLRPHASASTSSICVAV